MSRASIRQNPVPGGPVRTARGDVITPSAPDPVEHCPQHGPYRPRKAVSALLRRARGGQEPTGRARRLLESAARLQATCERCQDIHPTGPRWAQTVREAIEARKEE